jgi:Xaa-Pro aminopeptidase
VRARLDAELARSECVAAVVLGHGDSDPDLAAFAGGAHLGDAFVVAPRGAAPRLAYYTPMEREEALRSGLETLAPEALDVARLAREHVEPGDLLAAWIEAALAACGVAPGRLALAGSWPAGVVVDATARLAARGWSFAPGNEALRRARKPKSADDLAEIERVAGVVAATFRAIAARLAAAAIRDGELWSEGERLTVARVKREVGLAFAAHGLSEPRGNIVAPAEEGGVPHNAGTPDRVLRAGEALVVDLFPKGRLYADATRTFCVGPAPEPLARAHAAVAAALEQAHRLARPGVRGWHLQEATCALFSSRDWPTPVDTPGTLRGYVHGLGHGVGYELHEYPSFRKEAAEEGTLEVGDVLTLEPGLYEPGLGGFGDRLEDTVVLGDAGPRNLTPMPLALDPSAWETRR